MIALTSKSVQPCLVPVDQVFSHSLGVFAYDDGFHLGVLISGFHYRWAVRHASSMRTDTRYTPSDVFETFPQPPYSDAVTSAGKTLDTYRSSLMRERRLGLTDVYNLVHDPDVRSDGHIQRLRDLHVELDLVVRDAYGWSEMDLEHGFHRVRGQGVRFTFSPRMADEVLDLLLELNKRCYEAEVRAGLHDSAERTTVPSLRPANQGSLLGDDG